MLPVPEQYRCGTQMPSRMQSTHSKNAYENLSSKILKTLKQVGMQSKSRRSRDNKRKNVKYKPMPEFEIEP